MAGIKDFKQFFLEKPTEEMRQTETDPTNFTTTPNLTSPNTQMVSQNFTPNQTGWSLYPDGSAQFEALHIKSLYKTVRAGGDIQGAIDIVSQSGGGIVQLSAGTYYPKSDIIGAAGVSIVGAGRTNTIIDFQNQAYGMKFTGTASSYLENFSIEKLTVANSNLTGWATIGQDGSIHLRHVRYFKIFDVRVTGGIEDGLKIEAGEYFTVDNCLFDGQTGDGMELTATDTFEKCLYFNITNCIANDNGSDGFQVAYAPVNYGTFMNCHAEGNAQNGFWNYQGENINYLACAGIQNSLHGFSQSYKNSQFIGCFSNLNVESGFFLSGEYGKIIGCNTYGNGESDYNIGEDGTATQAAVIGCNFGQDFHAVPEVADIVTGTTYVISMNNNYQTPTTIRNVEKLQHIGGTELRPGDVVVLADTANGYDCITTTTKADKRVRGVCLSSKQTTSDEFIMVLREGKTTQLKVNGEEDIAVGDYLCTHTVAGVSCKASTAGQTVFARALEAYTAGNDAGVIDALIIPPRTL